MLAGKDFTPAIIDDVQIESPAAEAGLKKNDIVLEIDNNEGIIREARGIAIFIFLNFAITFNYLFKKYLLFLFCLDIVKIL